MLVGIDVGGTYTDGVAVNQRGEVLATAKFPTDKQRLLDSLLGCLDLLLKDLDRRTIIRVAISTTLLTNAIVENNLESTALVVIPGPGLRTRDQAFGVLPYVLSGAIDFRGTEIEPLDIEQAVGVCIEIGAKHIENIAVCGKFSPRNNCQELEFQDVLAKAFPRASVELGHRHYGSLNFPRRANTAFLTAATKRIYQQFLGEVAQSLRLRKIDAPLFILKADGGTMAWKHAYNLPVETIYSGPAASLLGIMALCQHNETVGVIDIGGTTTDIGLILSGSPLYSAKGAEIGNFKTLTRSFAVNSLALGGDSPVMVRDCKLTLGERRLGPAFCLGGPSPTPTDAMRFMGMVQHGSILLAEAAMQKLSVALNTSPADAAQRIVNLVVDKISGAFSQMLEKWQREPAYRVWQVLNSRTLDRPKLFGVGGGCGIVPEVAARLNMSHEIPEYGTVANALGAALAKETFSCTLRADTAKREYAIAETGLQSAWPYGLGSITEAKSLLQQHFAEMSRGYGLVDTLGRITREEIFNVVRGFNTEGKIIEVAMERQAGVLVRVAGRNA